MPFTEDEVRNLPREQRPFPRRITARAWDAERRELTLDWYRRDSGWFGHAVRLRRAHIRASGIEADVVVNDLGVGSPDVRAAVDEAYREKYGPAGASSMVSDAAAATTLRLDRSG